MLTSVPLETLQRCPACGKAFVRVTRKRFCSTRCQSRIYMRQLRAAERADATHLQRQDDMGHRRGHGQGSIRERQDGRWEVRMDAGRGADGKRRRKSAFAPTQGEAVDC